MEQKAVMKKAKMKTTSNVGSVVRVVIVVSSEEAM